MEMDLDLDPVEIMSNVEIHVESVNSRLNKLTEKGIEAQKMIELGELVQQMHIATDELRNIPNSYLGQPSDMMVDKKRNLIVASELASRLYEQSQQWIACITMHDIEREKQYQEHIASISEDSSEDEEKIQQDERSWISTLWTSKEKEPENQEDATEKFRQMQHDVAQLKQMFGDINVASVEHREQLDVIHQKVENTCRGNELIQMEVKDSKSWLNVLQANKYLVTAIGFASTAMVVVPFISELLMKKGNKSKSNNDKH